MGKHVTQRETVSDLRPIVRFLDPEFTSAAIIEGQQRVSAEEAPFPHLRLCDRKLGVCCEFKSWSESRMSVK